MFFFQIWRLEIATLQKHTCEVDEERSGNVDVVVELNHCSIDCNLKHAIEKTYRGWVGFTNWEGVLLFVGVTPLKGGSLSELPKTTFVNQILIRNRSFGGCVFVSVLTSWNCHIAKVYLRGRWGKIRQCWCSCCFISLLNWLQSEARIERNLSRLGGVLLIGRGVLLFVVGHRSRGVAFLSSQKQRFLN